MKQLFIYFATLTIIFTACTNNDTTKQGDVKVEPVKRTEICYAGNSGKDTVILTVHIDGEFINGNLEYKFFEKDKNSGTFDGIMNGDTLLADYTFMSEGTQSVRQVIFLKKSSTLTEGYGDIEEKNGKMVFKNTGSVRFGEGFVLTEKPCPN